MSIKDVRESGLLEYYALGLLSDEEKATVHRLLEEHPVLKQDFYEIQRSIQEYAKLQGIVPNRDLREDIRDTIRKDGSKTPVKRSSPDDTSGKSDDGGKKSGGGFSGLLAGLLGILAAGALWYGTTTSNKLGELEDSMVVAEQECDSLTTELSRRLALYENVNGANIRTLNLTPTAGYQETNLLFHINEAEKRNFIQFKSLPVIAANQTFQLWSLKDGVDPIPLSTFDGSGDIVIPVDYEEGTGTYAITIEAEGGAQVPTLTRLIGTVGV